MFDNKKTVICSVGGSKEPIIQSLKTCKPSFVIFYCSRETSREVTSIIKECDFIEDHEKVTTDNIEDLDYNLHLLQKELPALLKQWKLAWNEVLVDYTGGTKTMASALVLATVDHGADYVYIGGTERSKDGVGIVVPGTEKVLFRTNPWNTIAYSQRKLITQAFQMGRYYEALRTIELSLQHIDKQSEWGMILKELANVIQGYAEWDRFDYKRAEISLKKGCAGLRPYSYSHENLKMLLQQVERNLEILETINSKNQRDQQLARIADLLANAARRGEQENRYDDAVARLYRSFEWISQTILRFDFSIWPGSCEPEQIPESLREEYVLRYAGSDGKLKFGLDASYKLLAALGHELGITYQESLKKVRLAIDERNKSYLAHGVEPITVKGYESLKEVVFSFARVILPELKLTEFPAMEL